MAQLDLQSGHFHAAESLLGKRAECKIGYNTRLIRYDNDALAVRFHATIIYIMRRDGWNVLRCGGWETVTTIQRLNALLPGPWRVGSKRGALMLWHHGYPILPFADGLAICDDAIGIASDAAILPLLSAEQLAAQEAEQDRIAAEREVKYQARLMREHPTVGGPRTHTRAAFDRRVYTCACCREELKQEREQEQERLAAEHAAGKHTVIEPMAGQVIIGPRGGATIEWHDSAYNRCPWNCPGRREATR